MSEKLYRRPMVMSHSAIKFETAQSINPTIMEMESEQDNCGDDTGFFDDFNLASDNSDFNDAENTNGVALFGSGNEQEGATCGEETSKGSDDGAVDGIIINDGASTNNEENPTSDDTIIDLDSSTNDDDSNSNEDTTSSNDSSTEDVSSEKTSGSNDSINLNDSSSNEDTNTNDNSSVDTETEESTSSDDIIIVEDNKDDDNKNENSSTNNDVSNSEGK